MKTKTAIALFCDTENYANEKNQALQALLECRGFLWDMKMSAATSEVDEKWEAVEDLEKLYEQVSKLYSKINQKF